MNNDKHMRFLSIDIETTGLNPDRRQVIEVGLALASTEPPDNPFRSFTIMPRYLAEFEPQAWINDNAVPIDLDGRVNTWDCTDFLVAHLDPSDVDEVIAEEDAFIDFDDVLADDPSAPDIVRQHDGPFTIRVVHADSETKSE